MKAGQAHLATALAVRPRRSGGGSGGMQEPRRGWLRSTEQPKDFWRTCGRPRVCIACRGIHRRGPRLVFLQNEPVFDFVLAEPRHPAIVRKMNLPTKPVNGRCCSFFVTFFMRWLDSGGFRSKMLVGVFLPPILCSPDARWTREGAQRASSGPGASISPSGEFRGSGESGFFSFPIRAGRGHAR